MSCLVVLELENGKPNRPSLATISAAKKLSNNIDVLILESKNKEAVATLTDANNIFYFSSNQQNILAEEIADILLPISDKYNFLLAPSGTFSKKITSLCVHKNKNLKKTIGIIHMHDILKSNIN